VLTKEIFQLSSARDFVSKAKHDITRLRTDPTDAIAAFGFFVTVHHTPDWLYPNESSKRDALFAQHVELRMGRHLADGAKHFEATHSMRRQVSHTWKSAVARARRTWVGGGMNSGGASGQAWGQDGLFIMFDPRDTDM
jgi:hypothetical protein